MIEIVKDLPFEMCNSCSLIKPVMNEERLFSNYDCVLVSIAIRCENRLLCKNIRDEMMEEKQDGAE